MTQDVVTAQRSGDAQQVFDREQLRFVLLSSRDQDRLVDLVEHCSTRSRSLRFHRGIGRVPTPFARGLAAFDGVSRFGFGLLDLHSSLVAEARLSVAGPGMAEIALLVRDDVQGRGLGSALIEVLLRQARLLGVWRILAEVATANAVAFHLLNRRGHVHTLAQHAGVHTVCLHLDDSGTCGSMEFPEPLPA
jgi:GNAT superfamily N-acetyltransferase